MNRSRHFLLIAALFLFSHLQASTVLITGGSKGIGLEAAKAFNEQGWSVWVGTRKVTEELISKEPGVHFRHLDIIDPHSIEKVVNEIIAKEGQIDVLVNNAGYGLIGAVEAVSIEEAKQQFEVNFFSVMRMVDAVAPWMRAQSRGSIINISSTSGVRAVPGLGMYAASKFALEGYSEALAVELSPWNIHVTLVEPGTVKNSWAANCTRAANQTNVDGYDVMGERLSKKLISLAPSGQECHDIGKLVVQIANDPKPDLRYQTNEQSKTVFSNCLLDPTGNSYRKKWTAFMETLLDK